MPIAAPIAKHMPWDDTGYRVLPAAVYMERAEKLREYSLQFLAAVEALPPNSTNRYQRDQLFRSEKSLWQSGSISENRRATLIFSLTAAQQLLFEIFCNLLAVKTPVLNEDFIGA
jgi:hypothetical protein